MPLEAAALIVGNELLSGKIRDENLYALSKALFDHGILLRQVVFCRDDVDAIAEHIRALTTSVDFLVTSGGVGSTHDDVTMQGVALAYGLPLEESAQMVGVIERLSQRELTSRHKRMALLPQGAELILDQEVPWPLIRCEKTYVFPGVPELFKKKLSSLLNQFQSHERFFSRSIKLNCSETDIADALEEVQKLYAGINIGSYPRWDTPDYRVDITLVGTDVEVLNKALEDFRKRIASEWIVNIDSGETTETPKNQ